MNFDAPPGPLRRAPVVPTRLSMDNPQQRAWMLEQQAEGLVLRIKCNGIEQDRIVAYDSERGFVEREKLQFGMPVIDEHGRMETDIVQGRVVATWAIQP